MNYNNNFRSEFNIFKDLRVIQIKKNQYLIFCIPVLFLVEKDFCSPQKILESAILIKLMKKLRKTRRRFFISLNKMLAMIYAGKGTLIASLLIQNYVVVNYNYPCFFFKSNSNLLFLFEGFAYSVNYSLLQQEIIAIFSQ